MRDSPEECEPEWLDAEDPLFILYTSGSTGKPKGVLHTVAGYLLYTSLTFKYVFDHHHDDVYWCTADIGWITGHSYITYGPLANGATSVLFEGIPVHPHVGRFWEIIEKYKVTTFYTAPTAIRLLMKYGREPLQKYDLSSLRILGTVGEPINPDAWLWYHEVVGQGRCPVVDTFWQTETGGHVLTPLPAATPLKPGCRRDKDGYYWITGRIDDMLNVSGHLMSTAEVESALTEHQAVAEAAVVSRPHKVKGECLYCFVTIKDSTEFNHMLVEELKRQERKRERLSYPSTPPQMLWDPEVSTLYIPDCVKAEAHCERHKDGRGKGSGRPSARGVFGWLGGPVSGSRSPRAEPPESEAGPANDKQLSERGESNEAAAI
eukprot:superscaffoldBa00005561_g20495